MSPVRAFLALLAVLVAAGVVLWVTTRPERSRPIRVESAPAGSDKGVAEKSEPTQATRPTKAEAKRIFKALDATAQRAYRNRDVNLIPEVWTENSPVRSVAQREIRRLLRDSVLVRTRFETKSLTVHSVTPNRIKLVQVVVVDPRFITEAGEEITISNDRDRDTVRWQLRRRRGQWLIHRALVVDRDKLDPLPT